MKKTKLSLIGAIVLTIVVLFSSLSPAFASPQDTVRIWVNYKPGTANAVLKSLNSSNAKVHYDFPELESYVVSLPAAALNGILNNPNVLGIEEDPERYPIADMASDLNVQSLALLDATDQTVPYGIDMVQARDVWDADRNGVVDVGAPTGSGLTICVIDSGIHVGHEDLNGINFLGGYPSGWNTDLFGHGTHVSGTIAAMNNALGVVGVTPGSVNMFFVKVFGDDGAWSYSSTLVDALNRCKAAGAKVVSMSLGGSKSSRTEKTAFNTAYAEGVLSIAAAGNEGTSAFSYPASYDSVVSVAAIDINKTVADFSQYNSQVELAAPGVGVLSTVPYLEKNTVVVDGITYIANHIEFAARGTASGALVDGGLCESAGPWSGKVVLCQRGDYDFYVKVASVQSGGGVAAIIYNNVAGNFLGTLGEGKTSTIPAISLSMEDGAYLVANKLGLNAFVSSEVTIPGSGYEAWDGTSMATPHVSAVAALVWSANPSWTNVQIREALTSSALDLGSAGRDVYFGYGLVQAKAALDYLGGGGTNPEEQLTVTVATNKSTYVNAEKVTITVTALDESGVAVPGATVSLKIINPKNKTTTLTGTTDVTGKAVFSYTINSKKNGTGPYTITATASKADYLPGTATTTFLVN